MRHEPISLVECEGAREERPENYIVRHLMDMPEVDYDSQSELLFKLSGQMVGRLRAYLRADEDIENVLYRSTEKTLRASSLSK